MQNNIVPLNMNRQQLRNTIKTRYPNYKQLGIKLTNTNLQLQQFIDQQSVKEFIGEFPFINNDVMFRTDRIYQGISKPQFQFGDDLFIQPTQITKQQRLLNSAENRFDNVLDSIEQILDNGNIAKVTITDILGQRKIVTINNLNQIDNIIENTGGSLQEINNTSTNQYTVQEVSKNPLNLKPIIRSKAGQGNDLQQCVEFENENIYIPKSGQCLYNIICHWIDVNKSELNKEHILDKINSYCKQKEIYRHNIRYCDLSSISKDIGIIITNLKTKTNGSFQARISKYDILVTIQDSHYIQVKSNNYKQVFADINKELKWTDKQLIDGDLNLICNNELSKKLFENTNLFENVYCYDLEAYTNNKDQFIPYACGYGSLQKFNIDIKRNKDALQSIKYTKGQQCILEMIKDIDNKHPKQIVKNKNNGKNKQKQTVYLYAHNGAKFDSYLILQQSGLKFHKTIMKGGIMSLVVETENCKMKFLDSMKMIMGPLNKLCKSFKVPEQYCKSAIDHNYTESTWEQNENIWGPYLKRDISSLCYILKVLFEKLYSITKINPKLSISIASYAKKYVDSVSGTQDHHTCPVVRKFIHKSIRGGRVQSLIKSFCTGGLENINFDIQDKLTEEQLNLVLKNKDYLVPFDATSLYPSAMQMNSIYPVISSARHIQESDYEIINGKVNINRKCFFIECDIYIPEWLQFIPISIKNSDGLAVFCHGNVKNVVINHCEYEELQKFSIDITKIHQGIVYTKYKNTPYQKVIHTLYNERAKVKNEDQILGDMYKLIMNSSYGKTCEKHHESKFMFTEMQKFEQEIYDEQTKQYSIHDNQVLYEQEFYSEQRFSEVHCASLILSYSKRIMNDFILKMNAHKEKKIYYMDTDSMYIHYSDYKKYLSNVSDGLCGGKNDYGEKEAIVYSRFIGSKQKLCYSVNLESGKITKHVTWKGVQKGEFGKINCKLIDQVESKEVINLSHYVWKRNLQYGIQYMGQDSKVQPKQDQNQKVIRNDAQLQKYKLNGNYFEYRHVNELIQQ